MRFTYGCFSESPEFLLFRPTQDLCREIANLHRLFDNDRALSKANIS